jgi:mRNA interferase RelE/StbE
MAFEILLSPVAARTLRGMDPRTRARIVQGLRALEDDPRRGRPGADIRRIKGTKGRRDAYRLRVGDYRVLYGIEAGRVYVTLVFHRGRGYPRG